MDTQIFYFINKKQVYNYMHLTCHLVFTLFSQDAEPATASGTANERTESVGLLGKGPLPMPASITILPPSTGDDYDSDSSHQSEDEGRPLTQQELRQRIVKGVSFSFTQDSEICIESTSLIILQLTLSNRRYWS